jgi:protein involved in polysaccharide export with SLBB domain
MLSVFLLVSTGLVAQEPRSVETPTFQPGDVIRVQVWREPDLSGSFRVNGALPLLGEKRVTDIPIDDLAGVLAEDYRVHLRNPSINITPLRKVLVMGAVRTPGSYEVNPIETVIGVIAQAGGVERDGHPDRVRVVRDGQLLHEKVSLESTISGLNLRFAFIVSLVEQVKVWDTALQCNGCCREWSPEREGLKATPPLPKESDGDAQDYEVVDTRSFKRG